MSLFNNDSAFKHTADQMELFFERWEKSALQPKEPAEDAGRVVASHRRSMEEAKHALEDLYYRVPEEFRDDVSRINDHLEDADETRNR